MLGCEGNGRGWVAEHLWHTWARSRFISQQGTTTTVTEPSQGTENQEASRREISSSSPTGIN